MNLNLADHDLEPYTTAAHTAELCGVDVGWVHRQVRRAGVADYALTKGERQFDRRGVLRLLILARLQARFGKSSALPYIAMESAEPAVADLLNHPDAGTMIVLRDDTTGIPAIVVSVSPLRALLRRA